MKTNVADSKQVKLSCRNVWKVYGSEPDKFFNKANGQVSDSATHADTIREQQHIVANANVSFDVHAGEIFVIMGLSGSGKSTIVRCLSRLVEPTAGEIILDGENLLGKSAEELIDIRRHKMGMVFQSFGLMPHLTVIDNIAFPLKLQGKPEQERYAQAQRVIELVGLEGRENNYPKQLSGGQQQRVAIARSLANDPYFILADEATGNLDSKTTDDILSVFDQLNQNGKTIIIMELIRSIATEHEGVTTFSLITTQANSVVGRIHDRMPVMLPREAWETWLDPAIQDIEMATKLLVPAPADGIDIYPVSTEVNSVRNKGAHLLERVDPLLPATAGELPGAGQRWPGSRW